MPSFIYIGPPDEPHVDGVDNALTGEWVKGSAREIDDAAAVAWLRRHPHWREATPDAADTDGDGVLTVAELRAALDARRIVYDRRLGADKLRALLEGAA